MELIITHNNATAVNLSTAFTVTVPAGKKSATFYIPTNGVGTSQTAQFTATYNNVSKQASLTVVPCTLNPPGITSLIYNGSTPPFTGTVTLGGVAVAGGQVVNLTSDNPDVSVPPSVLIPAGNTSLDLSHFRRHRRVPLELAATMPLE